MTLNPLLIKLFGLLSIFSVLKSCNSYESGTWKNEKIEAGKRENFHTLNTQMLEGLKGQYSTMPITSGPQVTDQLIVMI